MERTIKNLLLTALMPLGKTLYIYGGGWNETDSGAGEEARSIGISPFWQKFYAENAHRNYNHKDFDFKKNPRLVHNGLDCTGYMGWVLYNLFNTENGREGFVYKSTKTARILADMGLGSFKKASEITDYKAGDIMGGETAEHIFICIGQYSDKSLLLLHSSPPAPMLSGTLTPEGEKGEAVVSAEKYMKRAYPRHFEIFPKVSRPKTYLTDFCQFRFYNTTVSDPEGYREKSPGEILEDLFSNLSLLL